MNRNLKPTIFREYDIRGIADLDLPSESVTELGRAIGSYILKQDGRHITLGRDCRLSSTRLHSALLEGLVSTGLTIIDIGEVPTPLLYFSVYDQNTDGGVMITGSHNPGEFNGFKICVGKSTIYGEQIQQLRAMMDKGAFIRGKGLLKGANVIDAYASKVISDIQKPLHIKVVVDSGNGMAGVIAPSIYESLGCEVISIFQEPDGRFPNHHPDPTVLKNLETLITHVKDAKTLLGIAFDGDADRIGVVDRSGRPIYGDELLVLYAREILKTNPGARIISEVKASHRLYNDILEHGGVPVMWKTGHSLIKAKMKEVGALLAGEMSGHMFFSDRYFGYDDAIYAGARLLEILSLYNISPSELLADLPPSCTTPEIRVDCDDDVKFDVVLKASDYLKGKGFRVNSIDGARVEFEDGWGLVRASNTQPVLVYRFEASSESRINEIRDIIESAVRRFLPSH